MAICIVYQLTRAEVVTLIILALFYLEFPVIPQHYAIPYIILKTIPKIIAKQFRSSQNDTILQSMTILLE